MNEFDENNQNDNASGKAENSRAENSRAENSHKDGGHSHQNEGRSFDRRRDSGFQRGQNDRNSRPERGERRFSGERKEFADRPARPSFDRSERGNREDRPSFNRDRRPSFERANRDDRPQRDNRSDRSSFDRTNREDRPQRDNRFDRSERPARPFGERSERPSFDRGNRDDRPARPSFNRGSREDRPSFDRSDRRPSFERSSRGERPTFDRSERPAFNRDDRPARPSFDQDNRENRPVRPSAYSAEQGAPSENRFERSDRPSFNREDRPSFERSERPAFNREDRPARPSFNRDERGDRPSFNREDRPSFDRGDRGNRENRPFRGDRDRPRFERSDRGPRRSFGGRERTPLQELIDMDNGLLRLVMRRTRLLASMAGTRQLDAKSEKTLRTAWENNAAHVCRDPHVVRDLFTLLQGIEALSLSEEDQPAFNLSPAPRPVDVKLPVPSDTHLARFWLALAAASGQTCTLTGLTLLDSVLDGVKSLNQLGGDLWYENDGRIISRGGKGLQRGSDKAVYVGNDPLNLWLCLALPLGMPYHVKISGDSKLRALDLSAVGRFLPQLNARLVNVIPAQDGLPVRVESSGMLPAEIAIPAELPADFVFALMVAAPLWESTVTLDLSEYVFSVEEQARLADVLELLRQAGVSFTVENNRYAFEIGVHLPETVAVPSNAFLAAVYLLLPALTSGKVSLTGVWTGRGEQAMLSPLLKFAGLEFGFEGDTAWSKGDSGNLQGAEIPVCPEPLRALLAVFAAGKIVPSFERDADIASSFFAQIGYTPEMVKTEPADTPWVAPNPYWAVVFGLSAYLRPRLRLVNPNILNEFYPPFWRLYNTLPNPEFKKVQEVRDEEPKRRRFIAQGVYGELPPEAPSRDDD